jgi:hypothetical protein
LSASGVDLEKYRRHFLGSLAETFLSPAARADLAEAFNEIEALRAEGAERGES